ncbi:hypothetical protein AAH991_00240 [Microbispora sp. ZYX-F-249]|uniref:FHA domain-containing protein n=1 Tax=Microbispora maris TaxID=3144104 RepID=A0ABV0AF97_9ACTN
MPPISRSHCEVAVHDGAFFVVDVSFSGGPDDVPGRGPLSLSAEDDLVSVTLESWPEEPGDQRDEWADDTTFVLRSVTGEICVAELYTDVQDGFLLLGEPERSWNVRVYTRADDEAHPREQFLVQFWPRGGST